MTTGSTPHSAVGFRSERGPILVAVMLRLGLVAIDATILATAVPPVVERAPVQGSVASVWGGAVTDSARSPANLI